MSDLGKSFNPEDSRFLSGVVVSSHAYVAGWLQGPKGVASVTLTARFLRLQLFAESPAILDA